MAIRWRMLALLFFVRAIMAFQFATVGAIAPLIGGQFQVDAIAIGALIGLYFAPGIVVALPGGAIANWLGDKRVLLVGVALMAAGSALMASSGVWEVQTTGRLISGVGGVVLNVVMSKMVMDWFAGQEIATAMATFVNSWPAGIAIALLVQPLVAGSGGVFAAYALEAVLAGIGLIALLVFYRPPDKQTDSPAIKGVFPKGLAFAAIVAAGFVWGLFNATLAIVFSFSPTLLVERGWTLASAGASTSIVMFAVMATGIFGGFLADRTGRPATILLFTTAAFIALLVAFPRFDGNIFIIAAIGCAAGLSVGPIMTLPTNAMVPQTRALGMGLFYTIYYLCFSVTPWISGKIIVSVGVARVFDFGAVISALSLVFLAITLTLSGREKRRIRDAQG
ncbi:MAG: MFS family permease [Paracoccaceae bacterium]|jgi:MFS family permease